MQYVHGIRRLQTAYCIRLHQFLCVDLQFCRKQLRQSLYTSTYISILNIRTVLDYAEIILKLCIDISTSLKLC